MTIDSAAHPSSDDISPVTETWEADAGVVTPATKTSKALADQDADSDLDLAASLRSDPWRLSHMMILVAIIAVGLWLVITLQWLIIGCLILMAFAMILGLGFILARLRSSRQDALLGILCIAAERDMPMAPAVAAFVDQFRGHAKRRVQNVVAQLDAGSPLAAALEETPRAISRDAVLMAWVGQVTGLLSPALRLAGTVRSAQLSLWMAIASRLAYLLGLTMAMQSIVIYLLYWYIPQLQSIIRDFGIRMPEITVQVGQLSSKLVEYCADLHSSGPVRTIAPVLYPVLVLRMDELQSPDLRSPADSPTLGAGPASALAGDPVGEADRAGALDFGATLPHAMDVAGV